MHREIVERNSENPIIKIEDLKPSADGLHIIGVFNPGACKLGDEIILLMRVAEACEYDDDQIKVPIINFKNRKSYLEIVSWDKNGSNMIDTSDPRVFIINGRPYVSSLSHLRMARSHDGVHFTISDKPFMSPELPQEAFGIEDCRITRINDIYYITYTAVSEDGIGVGLATTPDFKNIKRCGLILPPENKDVCYFPGKINNRFIALHRPSVTFSNKPSIWYSDSPDGTHWGNHMCILKPIENQWENGKIGAGPQPIKTSEGWLLLYHACNMNSVYSLFLCLLDLENPRRILKRSKLPILFPEDEWEKKGFFPNVVFCNGWVEYPEGIVKIYYGAADKTICLAEASITDLLAYLD